MKSTSILFPARLVLAAVVAAVGVSALALPAAASAAPSVTIQIGSPPPPPPRYEIAPAARAGYVWSPGHWEWRHRAYVWVPGTWLAARPGYAYAPPQWRDDGGHWRFQRGHWDRAPIAAPVRGRLPDRYQPPPVVDNSPGHRTDRGRDYRAGNNWPAATPGRPQ